MTEKNISTTSELPQSSYMIDDPIKRARRWIEETEEWQEILSVVKNAYDETKALLAEERLKFAMLSESVDDRVRTTARVNDKKGATAPGKSGAESKEFGEAWTTARDWCFKHKLPVYVNEPKWVVSAKLAEICAAYPDRDQWRRNSYDVRMFPKWACDILDKVYDEDSTFLSDYRTE